MRNASWIAGAAGVLLAAGATQAADGAAPTALEEASRPLVARTLEARPLAAMDDAAPADIGLRTWLKMEPRAADPFDGFARPVTNVNFHHPFIWNELRPLFMYHWFPEHNLLDGGNLRLYALQVHVALTDSVQLTAYKDGYVDLNTGALPDESGFADIAFGLKFKYWEDLDTPQVLSFGLGYETKSGADDVLEGRGAGFFDLFSSYARKCGSFNVIGTAGFFIPRDSREDPRVFHWHLHADYPLTGRYAQITPLVEVNGFSYLGNCERNAGFGPTVPLGFEGFDYTTLGADDVKGHDVITGALGFRWKLSEDLSFGAAYEVPLTSREDVMDKRLTLDIVLRF